MKVFLMLAIVAFTGKCFMLFMKYQSPFIGIYFTDVVTAYMHSGCQARDPIDAIWYEMSKVTRPFDDVLTKFKETELGQKIK